MFRKAVWRRRSSANQSDSVDSTNDDGLQDEQLGQTSQLLSISGPLDTDIPQSLTGGSEERNTSLFGEESRKGSCNTSQDKSPLGLHLVIDNPTPSGDIIFVHGLGGHSRKTWCWNRDLKYFWPNWLASEEDLSSYRIFTFGYNSNFTGGDTNLNIVDFAKDLLFRMLTFSDGLGETRIRIGDRSIIFVCHSLGGIVVKKAYVLGKHDPEFARIISQVYGIIFLGTPHRGAQYAKTLSLILSTAPLIVSAKSYIADLDTQSTALQDVNEQFRTACGALSLVSFFETQKTGLGLAKIYIVQKESGILGYPRETSSPLNADHHTLCKYKSPEDGNYISVRNALRLWASRIRSMQKKSHARISGNDLGAIKELEAMLDIREPAEDDLNLVRSRIMKGTCQWLLSRSEFVDWAEGFAETGTLRTFWLIGLPATGKTALASTIVDYIKSLLQDCQYHFFSASHQLKRTAAYCLRSIAFQLARSNKEFQRRLLDLHESSGINFKSHKQNFDIIWETIFEGIVFKMEFPTPLIWVLDAVDEVDSQQHLLSRLLKIQSATPIKILFTSRPVRIPSAASVSNPNNTLLSLSEEHTNNDIRTFVENAVQYALPDDEEIKSHVISQILSKSSGSFLWTRLAIEMLQDYWHTQEDIQEILTGVPRGMESLYLRMLDKVKSQPLRLQAMAKRILTWAACSWRPLQVDELRIALEPEFKGFVSLEDTILQICGHFVTVNHSKISLIHITARQFLLEDRDDASAFLNKLQGHEHIAVTCLKYLSTDNWRHIFKSAHIPDETLDGMSSNNLLLSVEQKHPFTIYATYHWAYHVSKSPVDSQVLKEILQSFLSRYCLTWIEAVALSGNLHHLTRSSKSLKIYRKRLRYENLKSLEPPIGLSVTAEDFGQDIQSWTMDLIRIVGKFGHNLVQRPSSIYRLIPPFCPSGSMIGRMQRRSSDQIVSVTGLPSEGWDDCLATVSVGEDVIASKVLATDAYFFVLISGSGTIVIWYSETCEEARRICHGEYVPHMSLSKSGSLLATAGINTYRVWDVSSGQELRRFTKATVSSTMAITFGKGDSELVVGLDDCSVTSFDINGQEELWRFSATNPFEDYNSCPRFMKFSPDLTKVAVAWRGRPLLVWDMARPQRQQPKRCKAIGNTDPMCAPESVVWQIHAISMLVLCQNTKLVEWRLDDDEQIEYNHITARQMAISLDGNFLLTSDHLGTISVWIFPKLNLIYRLTSTNEFVRDLTFSPDGQRFYDTRQSNCNVWEPDALVRPDEMELEDQLRVGGISTSTESVISHDESSQVSITALATDNVGKYYCCGREDGTVIIHEAIEGQKVRKLYNHALSSSVIALNWAHSGRYVVSADDSGRIISKRLEIKADGKWSVFPVLDIRLDEPVEQFLFNKSERLLLISSSSTDIVCDLKIKKELCRHRWHARQSRRWADHPRNSELLIWIDPTEIRTYSWTGLSENSRSARYPVLADATRCPESENSSKPHIDRMSVQSVALTEDKSYIIYEMLPCIGHCRSSPSSGLRLECISTSDLRDEQAHSIARDCLTDLTGRVKRLVRTYQDHIVFLDYDNWLCTWNVNAAVKAVQRHFFLPRDWLNHGTLHMAVLDAQGALLCPKHGSVAIVRNGLKF